ncbi:MAG: alpha/beta hydrolase fold domain-containing protein [Clostridia bacterium]|nr:alpha/beta hydrolase fold domain-containing protein [Clostridia bacterium]
MKKFIALLLVFACIFVIPVSASAVSLEDGLEAINNSFEKGEGPVAGDFSIDYRYYSPVKDEADAAKYPLVVWLHGLGDGEYEGKPLEKSQIGYWASDEFQSRFSPAGGAFIMVARSREELGVCWTNKTIEPLRSAIDDFISQNKENIDLSRIYIGGYSMGGKMTLKMAIAYPEMFAAAFPICPAWSPDKEAIEHLKDMPVWITSSSLDPLVSYYVGVTPTWQKLSEITAIPEKCRFSTLTKVCYADGTKTPSSHHAWFAVNYDLFTTQNGPYHYMTTQNALGEEVTLTYPDGMISWLSSHTSDYDGKVIEGTGNITDDLSTDNMAAHLTICEFFKILFNMVLSLFK